MSQIQSEKISRFFRQIFDQKNLFVSAVFITGLQAGHILSFNVYTLPQVKKIKKRSKQIQLYLSMNSTEQKISLINLLLTSSLIYFIHQKNKNKFLVLPLVFSWLKLPITLAFMKTNWETRQDQDNEKMSKFLNQWQRGNFLRIMFDFCSFGIITYFAIFNKKFK